VVTEVKYAVVVDGKGDDRCGKTAVMGMTIMGVSAETVLQCCGHASDYVLGWFQLLIAKSFTLLALQFNILRLLFIS